MIQIRTAAGWKARKKSSCRLRWNFSPVHSTNQPSSRSPPGLKASSDTAAHRRGSATLPLEKSKRPSKFHVCLVVPAISFHDPIARLSCAEYVSDQLNLTEEDFLWAELHIWRCAPITTVASPDSIRLSLVGTKFGIRSKTVLMHFISVTAIS